MAPEEQRWAPKEAGMNRFIWDMRGPAALKVAADKSMARFLDGPIVLPGRYQVRLTVGEQSWTQPFEVVADPRPHESREGEKAQYDLLVSINRTITEAHAAVNQIRDVVAQLAGWTKRLADQEGGAEIVAAAAVLKTTLTAIEEELFKSEPDTDLHYTARLKLSARLAALKFAVEFTDYAPTRQAVEVYEELAGKVNAQLARLREIMQTDLAQLNQQIHDSGIPVIAPSPADPAAANPTRR